MNARIPRSRRASRLASVALVLGVWPGINACQATEAAPATWESLISDFTSRVAQDVERDAVGGIVAGIAVDGDLVWAKGFGWSDRHARVPLGTAAVSRIGSISKSVTALMMMRLVDRGVVRLDDPVERYLPEIRGLAQPRPGAPKVTIRHLASHTAGIVREPALEGAAMGPIAEWEAKVLASIPATAFDSVPGARYQYSNIGFGILGLALSRAAGRPFMQLVEEEVFEPLGMTGSTFVVDEELMPRLAKGYENGASGIDAESPARQHAGRGYKVPNGGVYSTVADLARFAGAVSGTPGLRILSEESRREMLRVQTPEDPSIGYGLGLFIEREGTRRLAEHGGAVAGYTADLAFDPDLRIAVVLLRNYSSGATNLGEAAMELVRQLRAAPR
jgi:CubicO group peptidase (beta-lactamase class C family)